MSSVGATLLPEYQLLLYCARTQIDDHIAQHIRERASQGIDWMLFRRLAQLHAVTPLIYQNLNKACADLVPDPMLEACKSSFKVVSLHNISLTVELLKLLKLLEQSGIDAVPFKGPVVASSLYGDLKLREFSDLDILVAEADLPGAIEILGSNGYRQDMIQQQLVLFEDRVALQRFYHSHVEQVGKHTSVELHWSLTSLRWPRYSLSFADVQSRLEPIQLTNQQVFTLSSSDLLLYLCAHGTKHHWEHLKWVCDIAEFIRVYQDTDWRAILVQASRTRTQRMLYLALYLAHELLGAPLPAIVQEKMHTFPSVKLAARQLLNHFYVKQPFPFDQEVFLLYKLRTIDALSERLQVLAVHIRHRLKPRYADRALIALPRRLTFLYYPIRLIRLVVVYRAQLLKGIWAMIRRA